jgi:hypothetical protein
VSITIDTTAPDAPEIDTPTDGDLTNDNTPAISGTAEPGASVKVFDGATQLCTATADINGDWSCVSSTLADGSHTLTATATDPSGNESDASEAVDIEVDATAPAKPVVAAPANGSTTADDTPAISGTAEEDADVEIFVDGNSIGHVTADGDGDWSITSAHLTDGVHVITAQATDEAGNTGLVSDSVSFTVDTTPPGGSVAQQPGTGTAPGTNPTFFIVPSEGNSTITCSLDGAAGAACGSPFTPAQKLAPGTHTLTVTFTDPSGNSHQESITFVVAGDAAPSDATGCFAKGITIHNMKIVGSKLQIQGFARLSYVGKTVSIKYKPTKNKVVAKAIVQPDGSFTAITKAPKKSIRLSNDTRYSATVGSESTIWVKYSRRVGSAEASYSDGKLFVKGFLTKPLIKKAPAVISARTGCDGPWKNVASAKVSSGGQFNIAIPYTPSTGVVFVRVAANVAKGANSTKALKTYSYVIPVVVK